MMAVLAVCLMLAGWYFALLCGAEVVRAEPGKWQHAVVRRYGYPSLALMVAALICAARVGA